MSHTTTETNVELVLSKIDASARGPTDNSHWVVPGRLLASAYPGDKNSTIHEMMARKFIDHASIDVVVNLMEVEELKTFTPYKELMTKLANKQNHSIEFISFPIPDGRINDDDKVVLEFCLELCQRLKEGQRIMIHCWGGHGRTGTIVSILIGILFKMSGDQAIKTNSDLHDQRVRTNGIKSPETPSQLNQTRRILNMFYSDQRQSISKDAHE